MKIVGYNNMKILKPEDCQYNEDFYGETKKSGEKVDADDR